MPVIFKICPSDLWNQARPEGVFRGAEIDHADGYIHFSTADQVAETLRLHFAGAEDLLLIAVDGDRLGEALRYEASRGGQLFPHLYGSLSLDAVIWVKPLPLAADGSHVLPDLGA